MKYKLIPYEIIEKAIGGDTDLNDLLNSKLLEAILKFKLDYQPPSK